MSESIDDRVAAAIAHDSIIVRAVDSSASTVARAWGSSGVRTRWQAASDAFRALSASDRLRCGLVVVVTAVVTRLLLLIL